MPPNTKILLADLCPDTKISSRLQECLRKCFGRDDLHPENDRHGRIMSIEQNIKNFASFV